MFPLGITVIDRVVLHNSESVPLWPRGSGSYLHYTTSDPNKNEHEYAQ